MPADPTLPHEPLGSAAASPGDTALDPRLLSILVCPVTREALVYDREAGELLSPKAGLAYPIRGGIPIMLADEARALTE